MSHLSETRPTTRAVVLNAVLVAVLGAATAVSLATTGPANSSTTPTNLGQPGVSYTVTIPTPTSPVPVR